MKHIGQILDGLGVTADLKDDDLVASAVVVMSVLVPGSNSPKLLIADSDTMSWIEQAGLLALAASITVAVPDELEE